MWLQFQSSWTDRKEALCVLISSGVFQETSAGIVLQGPKPSGRAAMSVSYSTNPLASLMCF